MSVYEPDYLLAVLCQCSHFETVCEKLGTFLLQIHQTAAHFCFSSGAHPILEAPPSGNMRRTQRSYGCEYYKFSRRRKETHRLVLQNDPFSDPKLYVQTWLIKESIFTASTMITQSASVCNDLAKTCRWCDLKKKESQSSFIPLRFSVF